MMRHPIHPALVHFPIACWSMATATDFAGLRFGWATWQWSTGLLTVGCTIGLVAMLAGLVEFARLEDGPVMTTAYWHLGLMLVAFSLFALRLVTGLHGFSPQPPNMLALTLSGFGLLTLFAGGYLGGRLVYHHGVGVAPVGGRPPSSRE